MKVNETGTRRRSREMAIQLLFQCEVLGEFLAKPFDEATAKTMLRRFVEDFQIDPEVADYGGQLFMGVAQEKSRIDEIIQSHSSHWKVSRMGVVDVSVMRVAVYEMRFLEPRLNPKIAMDEAIELAKRYGSTESGSFVNGILDHIARTD